MSLLHLLADWADNSSDAAAPASRRAALAELSRFSARALAAALPLGLGTALPAQAGTRTILDVLQLAVQLERLQEALYTRALAATPSLFPAADATLRPSFEAMLRHQQQHVATLSNAITASGGAVPAAPRYDLTGSRNGAQAAVFPAVFSNFDEFLRVAQLLEDVTVRAYKAQVETLAPDNYILQTALQMHATEARHAARVRLIRRQRGATVKPWPSPTDAPLTAAGPTDVAYEGENALDQRLPNFQSVPFRLLPIGYPGTNVLTQGVPEAFDEPLANARVEALLGVFTY